MAAFVAHDISACLSTLHHNFTQVQQNHGKSLQVPKNEDGSELTPGESMPAHLLPSAQQNKAPRQQAQPAVANDAESPPLTQKYQDQSVAAAGTTAQVKPSQQQDGTHVVQRVPLQASAQTPPATAQDTSAQVAVARHVAGGDAPEATAAVAGAAAETMPAHLLPAALRGGDVSDAIAAAASQ